MMEIDAFMTELNNNVLGVEFCTSYADKHGSTIKGFYCHRDELVFCCGNAQNKYCCSKAEKIAQQQLYHLESSQASVLHTRAVSMITLISASVLTFIITIILTSLAMTACQRIFAKKFRSTCTAEICLSNRCNDLDGDDLCRALSASISAPTTTINSATLMINNSNITNHMTNNHLNTMSDLSNLSPSVNLLNANVNNNVNTIDQYAGPISNCSSDSTDQCTIDTNSTLLTNLSDSTNNSNQPYIHQSYNFNSPTTLNTTTTTTHFPSTFINTMSQQTSVSSGLNRITSALASFTNLLTSSGSNHNRNQSTLTSSENSLFHISGNDQLSSMIINQPPPPAYTDQQQHQYSAPIVANTTTAAYTIYDSQQVASENYSIQLASPFYNELCT